MHCAKQFCIVQDAHVQAVTLDDRISNVDQIRNAIRQQHHVQQIQMNEAIVKLIMIVMSRFRVAQMVCALILAIIQHSNVK